MRYAFLLALFGAGTLTGCGSAPATADPVPAIAAIEPVADIAPSGEVVLARETDGHFYADVDVDGATARMLVDTGASVIALADEDADALGVAWSPEDVAPVAHGAGGPVHGVRVTLDSVQLGDFEVRDVEAIVVPDLRISLLGQSFLSHVSRVEMTGDEMVLGG